MRVMSNKSFFESLQESLKEEVNNAPKDATLIFDSEDELYRDDSPEAEADFDADYEDVCSLIDDQVNEYLILNGYNKTWDRGGDGYKVKKDLSDIIGNNDGIRVYKNNDGGIDLYLYDHDGYTSGTLYTFKKDSDDEIEKVLQEYFEDDDISLYYFLDWVDAGVLKLLQERGLLVPLAADGVINESEELEPKFSNRKSFYGKAHVDTLEDGTKVLTSYQTKVASVKDGKVSVLCDKEDLTQTTLRHIDEFLKQCGVQSLPKKELVKLIDEKGLKESDDDFESYDDFSDGDIIKDVVDNFKEITGKDVKEVFNFEITGNDADGYFKQEVVDETGDKIIEYWKEKGLDRSRIDDLLYKLDDELQSRWWDYFTESVDKETGKEVLLGNDKTNEKQVAFGLKASDKMLEQDSTIRVYKNNDSEREYSIVDITELNDISDGDVQPPIDIAGLLTDVDSKLTESYGNWGTINIQSTRFNKDTNDSNALFELNVGKDTYLMSMILEENCTVLKVNNTNGKTIFKRKSNDVVGLAESYIKQFIDGKEADEIPECIKNISEPLHSRLDFIKDYINVVKKAPKENKEELTEYVKKEIYAFIAEVSDEIKESEPNDGDKLELPTFDKMVEEIFGKEWVKEDTKENKLELEGTETLKESDTQNSIFTSFRPTGQDEGLLGRLWFNVNDKVETIDLFKIDGEYSLVYGMIIPDYIKEFVDSIGGYEKFLQDAVDYVNSESLNEEDKPGEGFIVFQRGGMLGDSHDLEDKVFPTKEEAQAALKTWKDSYGKNKSYYRPEGNIYKYKGKTPKEIREEKMNESDEPIEAVGYEVRYLVQVGPGVYQSEDGGTYTNEEQAEDRVAELRAQGFDASYDIIWSGEEDPDYDKYADETDYGAEWEAEVTERFENRYMAGGNGYMSSVDESSLKEAEDPIKDDVKNDLGIEPGSDEEEKLDSLYEPEEEDDEPRTGLGTGYASFVRKPSNIEDLDNKAKYFTNGDSSYIICRFEDLSKDEFDKLQDNFSADNEYCKSFEPIDTDNYSFNVIQFECKDYDYKLLVDPSGFSYCRYVAKI